MTSREARLVSPKMLSGVSAGTWARIGGWAYLVILVVYLFFVATFFIPALRPDFDIDALSVFVPLLIIAVGLRIVRWTGWPQERAEVAAGYTTLRNKYVAVEQLDPKTGAVVRAGGQPFVTRRTSRDAREVAVQPTASRRPNPLRRLLPSILGLVGGGVFVIGGSTLTHPKGASVLWFVVPSIIVLYSLVFVVAALRTRAFFRRLSVAAPSSSFAFYFRQSSGLTSGLDQLFPDADPSVDISKSRSITAAADGLTLWVGKQLRNAGTIPWSTITSIQVDRTQIAGQTWPAVTVVATSDDAAPVSLPLVNANASYFPSLASRPEVTWIAAQLNALRTLGATARVI